jgi:hypothetical protein
MTMAAKYLPQNIRTNHYEDRHEAHTSITRSRSDKLGDLLTEWRHGDRCASATPSRRVASRDPTNFG